MDETKLNAFIGKVLGDLGGAFSVPMVRMGDKLGLYKALKEQGPMTPQLAGKTNVAERYAREWLSHQAASGYLEYDAATGKFALPPNRRWCSRTLTARLPARGFRPRRGHAGKPAENRSRVSLGQRRRLGRSAQCLFCTVGRFFRPSYHNNLIGSWLPALDGVTAKLEAARKWPTSAAGTGFRPS